MARKTKASPPVRLDAAAGAITGALEPLTYGRPAYQVFDDWLAMTEASLIVVLVPGGLASIYSPAPSRRNA